MNTRLLTTSFSVLALSLPLTVFSADSYLCVPDMAIGFSMDRTTKQWKTTTFKENEKFLVVRSKTSGVVWEVKKLGSNQPDAVCKSDFSQDGALVCEGFEQFRMNRKTLRFLSAYLIGYWSDELGVTEGMWREGVNTPMMQIGKCSGI